MMCAVSKNEATIIHRYLGYSRSDIAITGNARFDLLTDSSTDRREILLMPTLRSHLFFSGKEDFVKSEYYQVYSRLIQSRELGAVLSKHDCTLSFYLHPTFSHHESLFSTDIENINILGDSDIQISDLLMRCSMLVTDYSSVAWDMLYMNKPILFFQFDLDLFLKTSGSYMDMRKDLPGDRCETVEELLTLIGKYAEDGLRIPDRYAKMRESFFAYTDMNNCKRIAEEIGRRRL
jgi:CDP-glycerol glycerophosphotransferase (TagB/SpsB family)